MFINRSTNWLFSDTFENMVPIHRRFRGVMLTRLRRIASLVRANSYQFSLPNRTEEYCSEMTSLFILKGSPLIEPPAQPKPKQHGDQLDSVLFETLSNQKPRINSARCILNCTQDSKTELCKQLATRANFNK